jgi:hypothetical protein
MHAIVIYFLIHRRDILIIVKVGDLSVCSQKTTLVAISSHVFLFSGTANPGSGLTLPSGGKGINVH